MSGRQLLHPAEPVVHPDLHGVGVLRGELSHALAPLLGTGDRKRRVGDGRDAGAAVRRRHAAPGGEQARRAGRPFVSHLKGQRAHVGAGTHHRGEAVVRVALKVLDDAIVAVDLGAEGHPVEQPDVHVRADHCGHHRLAGEIHARAALRQCKPSMASHLRDLPVLHDECAPLDRRAAIAGDQRGPLVEHTTRRDRDGAGWLRRRGRSATRRDGEDEPERQGLRAHGAEPVRDGPSPVNAR